MKNRIFTQSQAISPQVCINLNKKNRSFTEKKPDRHCFYQAIEVSITSNGKNRPLVHLQHLLTKMDHLLKVTFKKNQLIFFTLAFLANSLTWAQIFFLIIRILWDPSLCIRTSPLSLALAFKMCTHSVQTHLQEPFSMKILPQR